MREGALAFALVTHFGMPKAGAELRLVHADTLPKWVDDRNTVVDSGYLQRHFDLLMAG